MEFCDKCRFMYNITKDVKAKQIGGKINKALNEIFSKYENGEELTKNDLKKIRGKDLLNDTRFENMTKKDQRKMISWVKSVEKSFFDNDPDEGIGSNKAFYICKYCKNNRPIEPGSLIYSKSYTDTSAESHDYTYAINDLTLARTKNYICPNPKCRTHKDPALREAAITKNSQDQIVYVCTVCATYWIGSV